MTSNQRLIKISITINFGSSAPNTNVSRRQVALTPTKLSAVTNAITPHTPASFQDAWSLVEDSYCLQTQFHCETGVTSEASTLNQPWSSPLLLSPPWPSLPPPSMVSAQLLSMPSVRWVGLIDSDPQDRCCVLWNGWKYSGVHAFHQGLKLRSWSCFRHSSNENLFLFSLSSMSKSFFFCSNLNWWWALPSMPRPRLLLPLPLTRPVVLLWTLSPPPTPDTWVFLWELPKLEPFFTDLK